MDILITQQLGQAHIAVLERLNRKRALSARQVFTAWLNGEMLETPPPLPEKATTTMLIDEGLLFDLHQQAKFRKISKKDMLALALEETMPDLFKTTQTPVSDTSVEKE